MPLITHQDFQRILNQPAIVDPDLTLTLQRLAEEQARSVRAHYKSMNQPSIGKHRIIPFPDLKD